MKVSLSWLKELADYQLTDDQLAEKLSLISIGVKSQTKDYLELDLTYNRGDLLSMRGVVREVAVITGGELLVSNEDFLWTGKNLPQTKVTVKNEKLCPLYCVAKIEGLKAGPSPKEWVKKLNDSRIRSIDTITDITNLIMLEFGQPMHAFDARAVRDEAIIVRTTKDGERITTLDGKTRDLDPTDLLITDSLNPLGIAGVMGGKDSEVSDSTTTILLEAAIFDPVSNRNSAKRHGLSTEASKRFQHGLTKTNLLQSLSAAIKMYESLGGKLTAINLVGDSEDKPRKITLTHKKIDSLLGIHIDHGLVESYLRKLGFTLASQGLTLRAWEVTVPYWRLDVNIEEDIIEEIARMYGYDKIDGKPLLDESSIEIDQTFYNFIHDLKVKLKNLGLTEVQTYSFYSTSIIDALGWSNKKGNYLVKVANPISSETEYLRQSIWPNLVEVVDRNFRKGYKQSLPSGDGKDIAIFEIGKTYQNDEKGNPKEGYTLAIALCNGSENPLAELYQIVQNMVDTQGVKLTHLGGVQPLYHPKRNLALEKDGKQIGILAEVHLRILNKLGIEKRVAVLEISIEPL